MMAMNLLKKMIREDSMLDAVKANSSFCDRTYDHVKSKNYRIIAGVFFAIKTAAEPDLQSGAARACLFINTA